MERGKYGCHSGGVDISVWTWGSNQMFGVFFCSPATKNDVLTGNGNIGSLTLS